MCHKSAPHIRIIDIILVAIYPPRSYHFTIRIIESICQRHTNPDIVAKLCELLLHSQSHMAYREFFTCVLIFIDILEDQIDRLCPTICVL